MDALYITLALIATLFAIPVLYFIYGPAHQPSARQKERVYPDDGV